MVDEKLTTTEQVEGTDVKSVAAKRTKKAADTGKAETETDVDTETVTEVIPETETEVNVVAEDIVENEKPKLDKRAFMYLGPNVPGGILSTGSVFKEIPEHLNDLFGKIPDVKKLFVEVKDIRGIKRELGKPGSEAFRLYHSLAAALKEEAGKNGGL